MVNGKTVLAVILARGGSKRVPRKNLREYHGKSLIRCAVEAARGSQYLDDILISTDDAEIKQHAEQLCIEAVDRPAELAIDTASSEDALRHVLSLRPADWVVLLQPTSPQRTSDDIDACIERAQMGDGCVSFNRETNHQNGAVYVAKADWLAKHDFSHIGLMRYLMPEERSLDIDNEEDFLK